MPPPDLSSAASPAEIFPITPSDTDGVPGGYVRAIMLNVAGRLTVVPWSGDAVLTPVLAAGVWHPMLIRRVNLTGTEAAAIPGMIGGR